MGLIGVLLFAPRPMPGVGTSIPSPGTAASTVVPPGGQASSPTPLPSEPAGDPSDRPAERTEPPPASTGTGVSGLTISLSAPSDRFDAGIPAPLTASVSAGDPPYEVYWNDSLGAGGVGPAWSVGSSTPGNLSVSARAVDALGETAESSLLLTFAPAPTISLLGTGVSVDVGIPFSWTLTVAGGIPPYYAAWTARPGGTNASATISDPSSVQEWITPGVPGPVDLALSVTDADGITRNANPVLATVYPLPGVVPVGPSSLADAGAPYHLEWAVGAGAPPLRWTVVTTVVVRNVTGASGEVPPSGLVDWSGAFALAGNASVILAVVDAAGANASSSVPVQIVGPVYGRVEVTTPLPVSTANVSVTGYFGGGVAPYEWSFVASSGERSNGSLLTAGWVNWSTGVGRPGALTIAFRVYDALGGATAATTVVEIPAVAPRNDTPPTPVTAAAPAWLLAPVLGIVGVGAIAFYVVPRWRRRNAPSPEVAEEEARSTIRRLLEQSGGIDRETLLYRGGDEGLENGAVTSAVDHWRREGRIETRTGVDGEELLAWTDARPDPDAHRERP